MTTATTKLNESDATHTEAIPPLEVEAIDLEEQVYLTTQPQVHQVNIVATPDRNLQYKLPASEISIKLNPETIGTQTPKDIHQLLKEMVNIEVARQTKQIESNKQAYIYQ